MGKDTSKEVKYRSRHKGLDHISRRYTHHDFKERMHAEVPQGGASGQVVCMVLDFQSDREESFIMDSENYSKASNWPIQDQHSLNTSRPRSRLSTSTRSMEDDTEISTPNCRRQASKRASKKRDIDRNNWGLTVEPNLGGNSMWQNDIYVADPPDQQQSTHRELAAEAPHLYAAQLQYSEQLPSLTVVEDKDHETGYRYPVDLPNASQSGQMFALYSHEPWCPPPAFDFSLPNNPMISSGGQPLPFSDYQFAQFLSQNTIPHTEDPMQQSEYYPTIWPPLAAHPSSATELSYEAYNV